MLIRARNDQYMHVVCVTGRVTVELGEMGQKERQEKAIAAAVRDMIAGREKLGDQFLELVKNPRHDDTDPDAPFYLSRPLKHVEFDTAGAPDPGPQFGVRDERPEKNRVAKRPEYGHLIDFTITANFARKMRRPLLTVAPKHTQLAPLYVPSKN